MIETAFHNDHTFVPTLINKGWVIDCGVNRGGFSRWISENTRASILGFEPDPRLFARLPRLPRASWHQFAVASEEGELELHLGSKQCSSLKYAETNGGEVARVKSVMLEPFLARNGVEGVDLLKMDIEGAELDVLPALSTSFLDRVKQITCEFHDFLDPESRPQVEAIISQLAARNFYSINYSRSNYGDVLFINRRYLDVTLLQHTQLVAQKFTRGGVRIAQRAVSRFLG